MRKTEVFGPKTLFSALLSGSKFSHLLMVRADGDWPPPPCGQPDHKISDVGVIGGQMCWHSRLELRTPITYMKTVPSLRPCLQVLPFPFPQKSEGGPPGLDIDFPKLWNWESGLLLKDIRGSNLDQALGVRVNQSTNYLNLFSEKDDKHVRNSSPDPMV